MSAISDSDEEAAACSEQRRDSREEKNLETHLQDQIQRALEQTIYRMSQAEYNPNGLMIPIKKTVSC